MSDNPAREVLDLSGADASLTAIETAQEAGVDLEIARRIWRALGFPDVDDNVKAFGTDDVSALHVTKQILDSGWPVEEILSISRVYGQSISRIADAETRGFTTVFLQPQTGDGATIEDLAVRLAPGIFRMLDLSATLLDYLHRKHLSVAIEGVVSSSGGATEVMSAGFVDIVGFSQLSEELHGGDLGDDLSLFDDIAISACAEAGARLVKLVGDAAMFVSSDPAAAIEAALEILEQVEECDKLPVARAGVDHGEVVPKDGDYFGRPVNVAARMTAFARPGSLVTSRAALDAAGDTRLAVSRVGTRKLKGVGPVELFRVRRAATEAETSGDLAR
ncbi:MAG: adenylate/guanylate cyclase domain-containing protein [Actinomycetota bacterium]|nr:adenylate/guanylate cyclase domain-containing protein [Actinomycetota bacterium]